MSENPTVRDYVAIGALVGLISKCKGSSLPEPEAAAARAYEIADELMPAMTAALQKAKPRRLR